jgi:hypothetical protein
MNDRLFRKLEQYRLKAQAAKYAGDMKRAKYYAYRYAQVYGQIAGHRIVAR